MKKTVLISGASVAELTMAYLLNRCGYNVTVVEIAPGLRKGLLRNGKYKEIKLLNSKGIGDGIIQLHYEINK